MPDGIAEESLDVTGIADSAYRQLRDFVIELDRLLDDHPRLIHARAAHGVVPGLGDVLRAVHGGLALARRRHHRLDDAGIPDPAVDRLLQLAEAGGKGITRGRQFQRFGREPPDALPVHGELRRTRHGDDLGKLVALDLRQHVRGDGLDLGHDNMRTLLLHQRAQGGTVCHVDHVRAMRDLVARRMGITIHRDDLHSQPLQGDDHFLAQFSRSQQHHARGAGAQWCADFHCFNSLKN